MHTANTYNGGCDEPDTRVPEPVTETFLRIPDSAERGDLHTFATRLLRLDDAAVIRLRARESGQVVAWGATGFDVLVCRVVRGRLNPADICAGADALIRGLEAAADQEIVDTGFPMDSAWRGALPTDNGFEYLDDVPARSVLALAQRGGELAREHGSAHGPPSSLLDQPVVTVDGPRGMQVGIPMRCVFALSAMGFVPANPADDEPIRVRAQPSWLRLDARYGSVFRRRTDLSLLVR